MKYVIGAATNSTIFLVVSLALLLAMLHWGGYLLFHISVELFISVVLVSTFAVSWHTRQRASNGYLTFLGLADLFIAALTMAHALAYRGMNVIPGLQDANEATQLWLAAMGMKAITMVVAPMFINRAVPGWIVVGSYSAVTAFLLAAVFHWEIFPAAFIKDQGLTPFKIYAEYTIMGMLVFAGILWWRARESFAPTVRWFMVAALVSNVVTEVFFTMYAKPEDGWNIAGHLFLVIAYYCIYRAIVQTALTAPYDLLLHDLERNETDLRRTISELNNARKQAENASRAKGQFLAVLSHELRTPLTPVLASVSDHLAGGDVPPHLQETFRMIHRNVELQTRLVDDLLDLTRVDRGKIRIERAPVDVNPIIRHAVATQRTEYARKGVHLTIETDAQHTWLSADSPRIEQVVWNLLSNACKFTPPGGHVQLTTRNEFSSVSPTLIIEVRDTGVGLETSKLSQIFEPFEQAHTAGSGGGLGLGLAISRAMVQLHGGEISARSDGPGHGCTFTVRLPTIKKPAQAQPAPAFIAPSSSPARNILLVEDHHDTARVIGQLLRREGHDVLVAHDIATATSHFRQRSFDLVISDIGLPDGSGVDMLKSFHESKPAIPTVCMSGYGTEDDIRASSDAGSVCHLVKPVTIQRLREAIAKASDHAAVHSAR